MFESNRGISLTLESRSPMLKNPEVVIAIAMSVKGSIFARSFERSSLM